MKLFLLILLALLALVALVLLAAYICYRMAFYAPDSARPKPGEIRTPQGSIYEPYRPQMEQWIRETRTLPRRDVSVRSFDGLTLWGSFYEYAPGAPIELMFHGYRGTPESDLGGAVQRCYGLGRSALLVDQRSACRSQGHTITMGIYESRDCRTWVDFLIADQGEDVTILLTGISMGATTVMLAAGRPLPPQVRGVIADCGFSSGREILCKVMADMHLPAFLYPLVRLGGLVYGRFDLEEDTALAAMERCTLPVFFIHGEDDRFVPCDMTRACYAACRGPKALFTVPDAGHGIAYLMDTPGYLRALTAFCRENGVPIGAD